jgi:hypothetical protein
VVAQEPLKTGPYVVRVRRNHTEGRYGRDVTLVTRRGFPRNRNFEDVEFPLEHRSRSS